ncbi:MAG TPA: class I SAM-dependent methyltransferase, partial [Solirubrobacteraceae bacterium]|nr:class I SAM-dependent methyltransferase [Solirubrobacteraceae bacterium]
EPETARMLSVLIQALAPARVLELGTSNGYSTVWLAEAVSAHGGRVTSVEILPERSAQASANLERAGLERHVELRVEDAAATLAGSADGEWDVIFLDSERPAYAGYWPDLVRTLAPRGLLIVDNVLSHPDEVAQLRATIAADTRFRDALVPIGAGVVLAVRRAET